MINPKPNIAYYVNVALGKQLPKTVVEELGVNAHSQTRFYSYERMGDRISKIHKLAELFRAAPTAYYDLEGRIISHNYKRQSH